MSDTELVPLAPGEQFPLSQELRESARHYTREALSKNTRAAYASDLRCFGAWCLHAGRHPLPADAETVRAYCASLADDGYATSTIARRLSAISQAHVAAKVTNPCEDPLVRKTVQGIRRELGTAPEQKRPILHAELEQILAQVKGDSLLALRDRALLLLGFACAMRRSELSGLDRDRLDFSARGLVCVLERSKTNQSGADERIAVPSHATRTIEAVRAWIEATRGAVERVGMRSGGPVFLSFTTKGVLKLRRLDPRDVGRVVCRSLVRAGLVASARDRRAKNEPNPFGAHSLRAGFITQARLEGKTLDSIMGQSRHRSLKTLMGYIRKADVFTDNAAEGVAL